MHAYPKTYIPDAQESMGVMLDYGTRICGYGLRFFYDLWLNSPMADAFGMGHPRFVAGMSGIELGIRLLEKAGLEPIIERDYRFPWDSPDIYWTGWFLAYFQWYTGYSFATIDRNGLPVEKVLELFHPLHEADLSKGVEVALTWLKIPESALKSIRKARGFTQADLASQSGVSLRMIRAYEQGSQPLKSAEASTVMSLASALSCTPARLLEL